MPSVFISYSHDPADLTHGRRVVRLAASLLRDGLMVFFDQNRGDEEQGLPWPIWMEDKILEADHVLLVCTELYLKKVRQQVAEDEGQGVCWEANLRPALREAELGFDICIDHHRPDFGEKLKAACPNGIDIYFENVGGAVFDGVLPLLNNFARIPVCGLIAHYSDAELPPGPDRVPQLMRSILVKRLTLSGFIVTDYLSQYPDFVREMTIWLREGRIKYREDITDGLENAPRELIRLLKGGNFGKKIIRVDPHPHRYSENL